MERIANVKPRNFIRRLPRSYDPRRAQQELLAHAHADFIRAVCDHGSASLLPARLRGAEDARQLERCRKSP
jgi:hypothetical protein